MVLNSNVIANEPAEANAVADKTHLVVNTTDFKNHDFDDFVEISEEIERNNRQRRSRRRSSRHNTMVATMTREEIFESTNMDEDQFLNALEHQNSYEVADMEKTVLLNSMDNLMKYFDEDVACDDSSGKTTPTKLKTKGKVASAMASLRHKAGMTPSPLAKRKMKSKSEVKANIQELKKCYEMSPEPNHSISPNSLKLSPKFLRKSKVKQMALLFNTKINSIMRKDSPEPQSPGPLSPGLESLASPTFTSTLKPKSPKLRAKLPTFIAKLPSPKPSPLFRRKQLQKSPSIASLTASPLMKRRQLQRQGSTTCLVAENVFSQLSVKDKALLYNKFIEDMSKKNPKFSKHAQVLENNVQKEVARGEVICEKQGTVKNIRDSLEAKFTPTKVLSKTLQRFKRSPPEFSISASPKSKEFEDVLRPQTPETPTKCLQDDSVNPLHVSTLTVILKPSPSPKANKYATKIRSGRKKRNMRFLTDLSIIEPSFKRTQEMIRSSVKVEPLAPPKKIRRTQHERLAPKMFFQNQNLEKLFYNWLKEKNGVAFDITTVHDKADIIEIVPKNSRDNVIPKDQVDELLEEAINKLEAQKKPEETTKIASKEESAINLIKQTLEVEKSLEKSVIEVELPLDMTMPENELIEKESAVEESVMNVTSITQTASENSHIDSAEHKDSLDAIKESSLTSNKPLRKKKLRRSLTWKKDHSLVECNPIFSTDSDSDCKLPNTKSLSCTLPKSKKCASYVKKLLFKANNSSMSSQEPSGNAELSIVELDRSLIRQVNSPSKIKSAYTLTAMSSPSPATESDFCDSDLPATPFKDLARSWPSLLEAGLEEDGDKLQFRDKSVSTEFTDLAKKKMEQDKHRLMIDSFIDQGFETGSNDMESPMRIARKSPQIKWHTDLDKSLMKKENPKNFSTPNKERPVQQIFTAQMGMTTQKNLISPIPLNTPMHRKNETMQMIKEDFALEDSNHLEFTGSSLNDESANYFTSESNDNTSAPALGTTHKVETSQFWISTGDFTAAVNIHFYEGERLKLLSSIFAQKCIEHREMTFGIDEQSFCPQSRMSPEEILQKLPNVGNYSQYWFSTGDVLLPFAGKQMSSGKIQTFFAYIREFMDNTTALRFGIDTFEFSYLSQTPATPDFTRTWSSDTPIKTSDLDQSDIDSLELEQSISFSALGSIQSDCGSLKGEEFTNSNQTFSPTEEIDSLDQIFEDARHLNLSKTHTDKLALETQFTVPEMLKTLQDQQHKLKGLEERMQSCANPGSGKTSAQINESPEYMRKLRSIISAIDNIGRGNGFDACSIEQLESFMFFLSRYADLCLANCTAHIEKILDVVMNQRSFQS